MNFTLPAPPPGRRYIVRVRDRAATARLDALRGQIEAVRALGEHEMVRLTHRSGASFVGIPDEVPGTTAVLRGTDGHPRHAVDLRSIDSASRAFGFGKRKA